MEKRTVDYKTGRPVLYKEVEAEKSINTSVELTIDGQFTYSVENDELVMEKTGIDVSTEEGVATLDAKLAMDVEKSIQIVLIAASSAGIHYDNLATEYTKVLKTFKDELYDKWMSEKGVTLHGVLIKGITAKREDVDKIKKLRSMPPAAVTDEDFLKSIQEAALRSTAAQWVCTCGRTNKTDTCEVCGAERPIHKEWRCLCGKVNRGDICTDCGRRYLIHV